MPYSEIWVRYIYILFERVILMKINEDNSHKNHCATYFFDDDSGWEKIVEYKLKLNYETSQNLLQLKMR